MICDPANPKGSGIVNVWQETVPIRFGAIDRSDRLTLDMIFQFFQEAAICHAENLGVGREAMAKTSQAWILSRMSVLVDRRPDYCETVTVSTWPRGWEKLFALRDFQIKDKDNIPVVSARSAWLVVDLEKRRPLRPQSISVELPPNDGFDALNPDIKSVTGLDVRNNLQKTAERKALYTDLDYNGHVNNIRYIQWIEDTLDPKLLEKANKMRLDINYLNEILESEITELHSVPLDVYDGASAGNESLNAFAFEGRKKESGQAAFRAELSLWV